MTRIENFILKVEEEVFVAKISGIPTPDPKAERSILERLSKKFPELGINPEAEQKILLHARILLSAANN